MTITLVNNMTAWLGNVLSMSTPKATEAEISAYLAERIRLEMAKGVTAREIAKRARVSHPSVLNLKNKKSGAGWKTLTGLADAFGLTMAQLDEEARIFAESHPVTQEAASGPHVEYEERYPNRAEAVRFARANGFSEDAIEIIASMDLKSQSDLTPLQWFTMIQFEDTRLRIMGEPHAAATPEEEAQRRLEVLIEATRPNLPKK